MTELVRQLTSPPDTVEDVHDVLDGLWAAEPTVSSDDRMRFETAIVELAANVIQHGDTGDGVSWELSIACDPSALTARLADSAAPANLDPERTMPDELAEDGRGLAFVRLLVDSASFSPSASGNEWRITKNRAPVASV